MSDRDDIVRAINSDLSELAKPCRCLPDLRFSKKVAIVVGMSLFVVLVELTATSIVDAVTARPPVDQSLVRVGMTSDEVYRLLGQPSYYHHSGPGNLLWYELPPDCEGNRRALEVGIYDGDKRVEFVDVIQPLYEPCPIARHRPYARRWFDGWLTALGL